MFKKFEHNRVFTESEAWGLFRLAAIAEACGWTLLISGIIWEQLTGWHAPVLIAGQLHGTLFFGYMVASIGLYPNLKWSRGKAFCALMASAPPYGSIVFEQWAAWERRRQALKVYSYSTAYTLLSKHLATKDL